MHRNPPGGSICFVFHDSTVPPCTSILREGRFTAPFHELRCAPPCRNPPGGSIHRAFHGTHCAAMHLNPLIKQIWIEILKSALLMIIFHKHSICPNYWRELLHKALVAENL